MRVSLYGISCQLLGVPNVSRALIFLVLPVIVTGGIHVDGYMDTSDAIHSYGDREKKLSILKDSHIGAFAVIRLLVYSAVYFAALFWMAEQGKEQAFLLLRAYFICHGYSADLRRSISAVQEKTGCCIHLPV